VLKNHFTTKNNRDVAIQNEYNDWIKTADYISFWNVRSDAYILLKARLGSIELISDITDQRIESLRSTITSSGSKSSDYQASDSSNSSNPFHSFAICTIKITSYKILTFYTIKYYFGYNQPFIYSGPNV